MTSPSTESPVHWFGELHAIVLNAYRDIVGLPFRVVTTVTDTTYEYEFIYGVDNSINILNITVPRDPSTSTDDVRAIILDALS